MTLAEFWFVLIGFMFASYFVLEGFDFGVGALLPILGKDDIGRRVMINTIGPIWDANETWLVLAAGAMFAAFPHWYATAFSAYYLPLLVILGALIVRGLAFEFRGKIDDEQWRRRWDRCIVFGSIVVPFLWGMFFANLVGGMAINDAGDYAGGVLDLFSPYTILGGLAVLSMFVTHGAIFVALKTRGGIRHDARELATRLGVVTVILSAAFLSWTIGANGGSASALLAIARRRRLGRWGAGQCARQRKYRLCRHRRLDRAARHDILCAALPERHDIDDRPREQSHDCRRQFDAVHAHGDDLGGGPCRALRPGLPGVELLGVPRTAESRRHSADPAARRRRRRQPIDIMRAIDPRLLRRARSSSGFLLLCVIIGFGHRNMRARTIGRSRRGDQPSVPRRRRPPRYRHAVGGIGRSDGVRAGTFIPPGDRSGAGVCSREIAAAARPAAPHRRRRSIVACPSIAPERSRNWPPAGWRRSTHTSRVTCHNWC